MSALSLKKNLFIFAGFNLLAIFSLAYLNFKASDVSADNILKPFLFNKNLKMGDIDEDARVLQKVLNSKPETEVSSYGAGSRGNETSFFGALTKTAVVKFQEFYASDILSPLGLSKGTGFVGITTRLKLNSLIEAGNLESQSSSETKIISSSSSAVSESPPSSSSSQPVSQSLNSQYNISSSSSAESSSEKVFSKSAHEQPGVRVYSASEYQIKPGSPLTLEGSGFAPTGNIVHIGERRTIRDIKTDNSSSLSFTVPQDLLIGKYNVWVENENGTSANNNFKVFFVITNNPAQRPTIDILSPSVALYDDEVIVSGSGFASAGNNIYSMFGNIMNISSPDGKTLKFKPSSMPQIAKMQAGKKIKNTRTEVWFYISNDNGYNKKPASFIIKL